jgi:hypothetical protein
MRLCKRNDRQECDNEKLKNSAYCFSCHKEIEETNNYVGSIYGNMLEEHRVAGLLMKAHKVIVEENREMMKIVNESMARIAAMKAFRLRSYQRDVLKEIRNGSM